MANICPTCDSSYPDDVKFCARDGTALRADAVRDDFIGELIADRYVITGILGEGGMGTVYLAKHVRLQSDVAIKILHADLASDPSLLARFRGEARAGSLLRTDRVAQIHDFGVTTGGHPFIAMEYVRGRTLADVLDERGALEPQEVAATVLMVAEGLDAAHRIHLIHRDLKPENVMIVDDAGSSLCTKVLDFGIAKRVHAGGGDALTQAGNVIGSPRYMSPEQVLGEELDARSDVYALGLLAFVALTGTRPFASENVEVERLARLRDRPTRLADAAAHRTWPAELQSLFDRVLAMDVNQRPSGALAFAKEFQSIIVAWTSVSPLVSPQATPSRESPAADTTAEDLPKPVRPFPKRKWIAAAGSVGIVAAIAYAITQSTGPGVGPAPADTTEEIASRRAADSADAQGPTDAPLTAVESTPPRAAETGGAPRVASQPAPPVRRSETAERNTGTAAGASADSLQLEEIMAAYDADSKNQSLANTSILEIERLKPRLTSRYARGWADVYVGFAWETLGDTLRACDALRQAQSKGDLLAVRRADEVIRLLRCRP